MSGSAEHLFEISSSAALHSRFSIFLHPIKNFSCSAAPTETVIHRATSFPRVVDRCLKNVLLFSKTRKFCFRNSRSESVQLKYKRRTIHLLAMRLLKRWVFLRKIALRGAKLTQTQLIVALGMFLVVVITVISVKYR